MRSNPIPELSWVQALADNGAWVPPPEWAQDYPWIDQLPRPMLQEQVPTPQARVPGSRQRIPTAPNDIGFMGPRTEWTDIPDWLQALNDDRDYERGRVIQSPYGGWGGGAMQARRRGLR